MSQYLETPGGLKREIYHAFTVALIKVKGNIVSVGKVAFVIHQVFAFAALLCQRAIGPSGRDLLLGRLHHVPIVSR